LIALKLNWLLKDPGTGVIDDLNGSTNPGDRAEDENPVEYD
jgi:hypothetical protein